MVLVALSLVTYSLMKIIAIINRQILMMHLLCFTKKIVTNQKTFDHYQIQSKRLTKIEPHPKS